MDQYLIDRARNIVQELPNFLEELIADDNVIGVTKFVFILDMILGNEE